MSAAPRVFTIAPGGDFATLLAQGLLARFPGDALALSDATIFLPTRRAARGLGDAFARVLGGAALLPSLQPLGDADEDGFDAADGDLLLPPAMARLRRQLLLANLIRQWDSHREQALSFAQAAALADSLAQVMDEVETQGCDLGRLKDVLPAELAEHWEGVVRFLDVIQDQWPTILAAEKALNPAARRNAMLEALARRLAAAPPRGPVIAAGSTGSIPATAALLKVIAHLPQGAVVLPGLDRMLDDKSWADLDPGHPQYGLKQLLDTIGLAREAVADWHPGPANPPRERLLSEVLRPAPTTQAWRALAESGGAALKGGTDGLALMVCADPAEEALSIALALRHALETPDRTAALVTPDRTLARRVAGELTRWGVSIDDSAGRPLAHTAVGGFLCLLAEAAAARFAPVPLLALLKHPFSAMGQEAAQFRARTRELDRWCLRGPRPDQGLAGIARAIAQARDARRPPPAEALASLSAWWDGVAAVLRPLEILQANKAAQIGALLDAHIVAAEALTCEAPDACVLWRNADGEAASTLFKELGPAAEGLAPIEPDSWPALLRQLAMKTAVRAPFGRHPRLTILGPLEARLQRFDLTILGGLNEGSWPGAGGADPWFSRPMRASLGLEQPERRIGLSAHDFVMFAAGPQVLLTRAAKQDGAPTVASRWLQRLEQLLLGLAPRPGEDQTLAGMLAPDPDFPVLARRMMAVPQGARLARPSPRPPVAARPRKLSVTEIETWLRDPYAIYARHVLKLEPLPPLDEAVGARERGTALHQALEHFLLAYPDGLPDDALLQLAAIADTSFAQMGIPNGALAVWRPRFLAAAQGFLRIEAARRGGIDRSFVERRGSVTITAPGGDFTLSGRADRIDLLKGGGAAIMDYKSGRAPSQKQVEQLLSPQLPLEAAMLARGGFPEIGARAAEALIYLGLFDKETDGAPLDLDAAALAEKALAQLTARVRAFDDAGVGYASRLMPYRSDSEGDYDHLARVREWSAGGGV